MKTLVIAEKPSVGRDIARVLKCNRNINGGLEGNQYVVTWGFGHLVTLADPEQYDGKYKEWKMENLPMMPDPFKLEVIKQTGKQYQAVKSMIHRKDVKEIVIATDAGREGELVARLILLKAGNQKPLKRLWISSVTDKAIKDGFAQLKDGKAYQALYDAAMCRAQADWLVGMNATRALTCKYNAQLSCGRVQTPTVAMICKREKQIKEFVSKSYYGIQGESSKYRLTLTWIDERTKQSSSFDKEKVVKVMEGLNGKSGVVRKVEKSPKRTYAPSLYDLTELQRDANKRFDFSAKETLNIMQRLYENHKVLTYPRTDSRYLSSDIVPTLKERLRACSVGPYKKVASKLAQTPISAKAGFVDDKKVSDHHAIIPTEQVVYMDRMTVEERKIYDLVVRRFLAVLCPAFEYEQTSFYVSVGNETFVAKGKVVKELGWKIAYEEDVEDDSSQEEIKSQRLPDLKQSETISDLKISMTEGKTKPPAYFNEATLLSAMENPVAYMDSKDKTMAKTLGETGGLGTVATRADIIEKLFASFLLEKKGKEIHLTSKARQLLELVPEDLKQPELTASWEMRLSEIAKGKRSGREFMKEIRHYSEELVSQIKVGQGQFRHDNLTNKKCPTCEKRLLMVKGKNSEMLVCQDRECGYRETLAKTSNARCPVCHKKMELRGKGEAQIFVCKCGHKEKLTSFQERRKKEGAGVSKKDVQKYLDKQKKEAKAPVNQAFANVFAKLDLDLK